MKRIIQIACVLFLCIGCTPRQKASHEMTIDEWKAAALAYTNNAYDKDFINDEERDGMIRRINQEYKNQYKFDYQSVLDYYTCSDALSAEEVRLYRAAIAQVQQMKNDEYENISAYMEIFGDFVNGKGNQDAVDKACDDAKERINRIQDLHQTEVLASIGFVTVQKKDEFTGWTSTEEHLSFVRNDSVFDLRTGLFLQSNR